MSRYRRGAILVSIVAAGALLRLWNLSAQVLGGDELHLVRAVLRNDLPALLVTFQRADASIPLSAFFRVLYVAGTPLNELWLRTPSLLAGIALIALFPWLLRRWGPPDVGRVASLPLLAGLVAVAPALVLYSRIVRSYSILVLLCAVATLAFYRFWTTDSRRAAVVFAATAALAIWFHPGAGPIVAAPFPFALADWLWRRHRPAGATERSAGPRALLLVGAGCAAATAALLGPAAASLETLVTTKREAFALSAATVADVARLQAGTGSWLAASLFWLAVAAGLGVLLARCRRFALFSLCLVVGQGVGILLLSPMGLANPLILNRYLLPATPWILLWLAAAVSAAARARPSWLLPAVPVALLACGPLVEPRFRASSFAHHNDAMLYTEPWEMDRSDLPVLYKDLLRRSRPADRFAEYPFVDRWYGFREIPLLQLGHRHGVVVVGGQAYLSRQGLRQRNAVRARPAAVLASGARFLIIHHSPSDPADAKVRRLLRAARTAWGRPVLRQDGGKERLTVWDLEAVRARARN